MLKKSLCILCMAASAAAVCSNKIIYPELLPKAVIHPDPVSKSQWLWNADKPIKDNAYSYFRLTFDVPEKVSFAYLTVKFDDSGSLYLNGKKISAANFPTYLKKGKNVLAFELKNAFGPSGIIFLGEIELASGKKIAIHSDKSVKASAVKAPNWTAVNFNDSRWKPAKTMGDCTAIPWSRYGSYIDDFTTEAEKKKYDAEIADAIKLPAGLEKEAPPKVKIVYKGNTPMISINGNERPVLWFLGGANASNQWGSNIVLKTSALGFDIFQTGVSAETFWKAEGQYDFSRLDRSVRRILALNNDAKILVSIKLGTMVPWCEANPEETVNYAIPGPIKATDDEFLGRTFRPSAASEAYRKLTVQMLRELAKYIKSKPWGNRVIGFRPAWGVYGEWHCYSMYQGPDTSKPMARAFRKYIKNKYKTQAALRKAWGDKKVTFANAMPPTMAERTNNASLLDPRKNRKYIDFVFCLQETIADLMLLWAKELKTQFPDRLCGAYYGYVLEAMSPEGANCMMDKVLSSPYIDFLSDPPYYSAVTRQAGGTYHNRSITSIYKRYGKLVTVDDDFRYHFLPGFTESYATRDAHESIMCGRRNYCNHLFNNTAIQINDPMQSGLGVSRPHGFDNKDVLDALESSIKVVRDLGTISADSHLDTAVVVNYYDRFYWDGGKRTPLLFHVFADAPLYILRSGMAFDLITLQDYLANKKDYKNVFFLSCFAPTPAERAQLIKKTRKAGTNAVWMVAPGCITENSFSDRAMSELAGMKLSGSGVEPRVVCRDNAAVRVGNNIYRKSLGNNVNMYFVSHMPYNSEMWRDLFSKVGMHAYAPVNNYFRRHDNIFMYHTVTPGKHKINLPAKYKNATVTERFSGKKYKANAIEVNSKGAGTWLFTIDK